MRRNAGRTLCCLWAVVVGLIVLAPSMGAETAVSTDSVLPFPFSAEQIRDAMPVGLVVVVENTTAKGSQQQRWTVRSADQEGLEMEYADLDASGEPLGEPAVQRTAWTELRDHATFPASSATRREDRRTTALGELDGWLYVVEDAATGSRSEFFFAKDYPGAPVDMTVHQEGAEVMSMRQLKRDRP